MTQNLSGDLPRSSIIENTEKKIIIASNNAGKIKEFKALFEPMGLCVLSMKEAGIDVEIIEDGETFAENAHIKAKTIFDMTGIPTVADDSGLEIDFLSGAPGIFSARYAGENATDKEKIDKVLRELAGVDKPLRTARFVCVIYYIADAENEYSIKGTVEGYIAEESVGDGGFGYDPIFMVNDDESMAEISEEEKNKISHRAKAFAQLKDIMMNNKRK